MSARIEIAAVGAGTPPLKRQPFGSRGFHFRLRREKTMAAVVSATPQYKAA